MLRVCIFVHFKGGMGPGGGMGGRGGHGSERGRGAGLEGREGERERGEGERTGGRERNKTQQNLVYTATKPQNFRLRRSFSKIALRLYTFRNSKNVQLHAVCKGKAALFTNTFKHYTLFLLFQICL